MTKSTTKMKLFFCSRRVPSTRPNSPALAGAEMVISIMLDNICITAPLVGYWFIYWAYVSREEIKDVQNGTDEGTG